MLSNAKPYDIAPDRWHGQRVQFEIDGKVRYDSEKNPTDGLSLTAVRLIPPAHLDKTGNLVIDNETDRLVFLWEATKGTGLDPATNTPLPPLAPDDPQSPPPENPDPPRPDKPVSQPDKPDAPQPDKPVSPPPDKPDAPPDSRAPDLPEPPPPGVPQPDAPVARLPGEDSPLSNITPGASQPDFGPPLPVNPGGASPPVPQPGGGLTIDDFIKLLNALKQFLAAAPPATPTPSGLPPAVFDVKFTSGSKVGDSFTVEWQVTKGDESQVASYQVDVVEILPDQSPIFGRTYSMPPAGPGQRSSIGAPGDLGNGVLAAATSPVPRFLQARVTVVPTATSSFSPNPEVSAARMVFPVGTDLTPSGQGNPRANFKLLRGSSSKFRPMTFAEPAPPSTAASVWTTGDLSSGEFMMRGIRFEAAAHGWHLFMRPEQLGDKIRFRLLCKNPGVAQNLVADLGFRGTGAGSVTATIKRLDWFDQNETTIFGSLPLPNPITTSAGGPTASPLIIPVDPTLFPILIPTDHLIITMEFSFNNIDPKDPPVLFGVRLIP